VGVFRRAQELAVALEVRDWGAGPRSRWRARPWAREDAVAAAAVAALAAWLAVGRLLGL
jgi:energy-coupling factor transporter transmembrane protein EcfT